MLAELIQKHPELKLREDSEFFEDEKGKLYIRAKGAQTFLQVEFEGPKQELVTRTVPKEVEQQENLKRVRPISDNRQGFKSD